MFTLVEECMRRIGLHHQTLPGFTHVPLSDPPVVPIPNCQSAFQYIEKLRKWVLMKWNSHARHDRRLKNGEGVARVLSQGPPQQLHLPDIKRAAACFVVLNHVVKNDFFKRRGEVRHIKCPFVNEVVLWGERPSL